MTDNRPPLAERFIAPLSAVTEGNIRRTIEAFSNLESVFDTLCEAAEMPENAEIKDWILERAVEVGRFAERLESASPIKNEQ